MAERDRIQEAKPGGLASDPVPVRASTEVLILAHLIENELKQLLPDGMTVEQYSIINHLLRVGRNETVSQLAHAHQVTQPTMSSNVRRLEDNGMVELVGDPADRRIRYVALTDKARDVRSDVTSRVAPAFSEILSVLKFEEWVQLEKLLYRVRVDLDSKR